jgi:predicted permease
MTFRNSSLASTSSSSSLRLLVATALCLSLLITDTTHCDAFAFAPSTRTRSSVSVPTGTTYSRVSTASLRRPVPPASAASSTAMHMSLASTMGGMGLEKAVAIASLSATAKLLSSIGLGGLAAQKPGVLDADAVSALSRLTYWVFQPAFLFASVGKTLYQASTGVGGGLPGRFLVVMPVAAIMQIALGAVTGSAITRVGGLEAEEARDVRMCTTFANSGPLPLIFADALFAGSALQAEVAACVSFYLLIWSPLFWSFGRVILGTYADDNDVDGAAADTSAVSKMVQQVKKILSPPVIGSILGVVVGGVPILQRAFFGGGIATPLTGALQTLGTAYLPAAILVLAGSLVKKQPATTTATTATTTVTTTGTNGAAAVPKTAPSVKAVVAIFMSRFLLAPLLSLGLLQSFVAAGILGPAGTRARAVVSFVLLMEGCMPPAQNSVIMLQLEGLKERASTMAKLLTLMYSLAVIPVTFLLSACLATSGIMAFK